MNSAPRSARFGSALKIPLFYLQDYTLLAVHSVRAGFTTTRYATDLVEQMDQIGVGSVPIIIVALACVGGRGTKLVQGTLERF